jgi:diguanylate cyclase (GGDEF)-like protein
LAGVLLYAAASTAWHLGVFGVVGGHTARAAAHPLFFLAYACYAVALARLVKRQGVDPVDGRAAFIDALIIALTLLPAVANLADRAVVVAYAAVFLVFVTLGLRVVLVGIRSRSVAALLLGWLGCEALGNLVSASGRAHSLLWGAAQAALIALAVHPAVADLASPSPRPPTRWRLGVLLGALVAPVAVNAAVHWPVSGDTAAFLADSVAVFALVVFRLRLATGDLSEQRRLSRELLDTSEALRNIALHDPLTGAPNRALLFDRMEQALSATNADGGTVALLLLDLDGFKVVNDTMGHDAGDALLRRVAQRLQACVRPSDVVARLGGDEFAILIEDATPASAAGLASVVVKAVAETTAVDDRVVRTRASAGLYLAEPGADVAVALRNADIAMYAAKERGGDRFEVFEAGLYEAFVARHRLEVELREATSKGELLVYYQPVIRLADGGVDGVEALVRWQHPKLGLVSPAQFMPLAEETGMILEIGRWVLAEACRQLREWQVAGVVGRDFTMAVNLSRRQLLDPAIVAEVGEVVAGAGVCPKTVVVEVTETALMSDTDLLAGRLRDLAALGLTVAMDDFGTGYSSLEQLRRLPIDILKIDMAFVQGIDRGPEDFALATAIVKLAASLGKQTLAEGVETPAQLAHLRALRAGKAQGYLFAKPTDADTAARFIQQGAPTTLPA